MLRRWTFGQGLFALLAVAFLVTGFWGVSQSKMLLTDKQMKQVEGGASISLTELATDWRPQGYPTENVVNVTVTLSGAPADSYVNFTLLVTDFAGYCTNVGTQTDSDPDLKFLPVNEQYNYTGQGLTWSGGGGIYLQANLGYSPLSSFKVRLKAYDWGGYGDLYAVLRNQQGTLQASDAVSVPRDDNDNGIVDGWQDDYVGSNRSYSPDVDDEIGPGNNTTYTGDGLSVFEEYRGVRCKGNWTDLDPTKREVFIVDFFGEGIGNATNLPSSTNQKIIPRVLYANETTAWNASPYSMLINWRTEDAPGWSRQRAIRLVEAPGSAYYGLTTPERSPLWPNILDKCAVYPEKIEDRFPNDIPAITAKVIGHEIGHAINLDHYQAGACIMEPYPEDMGTSYDSYHWGLYRIK